jgi:hypothetical protein
MILEVFSAGFGFIDPQTMFAILAVLALLLAGLQLWRWSDRRYADRVWHALAGRAAERASFKPKTFDPAIVQDLPEPARRYFRFAIKAGTHLYTVTEIRMGGRLGLGTKNRPAYAPMHAEQILAPPYGLVWKLKTGRAAMRIAGSDGFDGEMSWVRFWLAGLVPIVRAGGNHDHARAAFGRVVAEAVFWAPAALLPQRGVTWESVDANVARATVSRNGMTQTVDVTVAEDGQPTMVVIPRWTDANPEKTYRLQPFGGYLSEFRDFAGYMLPTHVEGGNLIGTVDYFPFYIADVEDLRFTGAPR